MRTVGRAGVLACCLVAAVTQARAAAVATILDYGEYTAVTVGLDQRPMLSGTFTHTVVNGVAFVERTTQIEARLCRRFGIRYTLSGVGPGDPPVVLRTTHPPLVSPDGQRETASVTDAEPTLSPTSVGFEFSAGWEIVAGTWTFALVQGETVLAEQSFTVSLPTPPKPPLPGCQELTS